MSPLAERLLFLAFGAALFAMGWILTLLGQYPLAAAVFPVPMALLAAQAQARRMAGLMAAALLAALLGGAGFGPTLGYLLAAIGGALLGMGFRARWSFGQCVTVGAAYGFGLAGLNLALNWEAFRLQSTAALEDWAVQMRMQAEKAGTAAPENVTAFFLWMSEHWAALAPGLLFAQILLAVTAAVAFCGWWLRRAGGGAGPATRFGATRPPDWLAWVAIGAALLWIADQYWWSHPALRFVAWNGAIVLAAVYFLNGLAILIYGLSAFQAHPIVIAALVFLLIYLWAHPAIAVAGLFDTWGEFRLKIDRLVAARKARDEEQDEES